MYAGMQALRSLSPAVAASRSSSMSFRGQEACRASSLLSLEPHDLLSDLPGSTAAQQRPRSRLTSVIATLASGIHLLPSPDIALDRLRLAIGAASAIKVQADHRLVLAFVEANTVSIAAWKPLLGLAGRMDLPIVFVLLPTPTFKSQGVISDRAQSWGVPGMPVDAADPIALYRVLQESVLRARSGDGPALIECLSWSPAGTKAKPADALDVLRAQLRARGLLPHRLTPRPTKAIRRS